jgi:hypothetical protein
MHDSEYLGSQAESLARMMDLDSQRGSLWSPAELQAIFEHQLDAPLADDLAKADAAAATRLRDGPPVEGRAIRTFRDLFAHPRPPLELLDLTKRFAKQCRKDRDGPLPEEIATALYFLAIVKAMTAGRRISELDDQALRFGITWALEQPWLDAASAAIFRAGLAMM